MNTMKLLNKFIMIQRNMSNIYFNIPSLRKSISNTHKYDKLNNDYEKYIAYRNKQSEHYRRKKIKINLKIDSKYDKELNDWETKKALEHAFKN